MVEVKLDGCVLKVSPANPRLARKIQLKPMRKRVEWRCLRCKAKNILKVGNLPYEFNGGDDWSKVIKSAAYIQKISRVVRLKRDLISFLVEKAKLKKRFSNEKFQLKKHAATLIKEKCVQCGVEAVFNVELMVANPAFPDLIENLTIEGLNVKTRPDEDDETLSRLIQGYRIHSLMKSFSLEIRLENVKKLGKTSDESEALEKLLEWIKNLINDLDKAYLFDEVKTFFEKLTEKFQTRDAAIHLSQFPSLIERTKASFIKSMRRKLFLSLAKLEEQIESILLKDEST